MRLFELMYWWDLSYKYITLVSSRWDNAAVVELLSLDPSCEDRVANVSESGIIQTFKQESSKKKGLLKGRKERKKEGIQNPIELRSRELIENESNFKLVFGLYHSEGDCAGERGDFCQEVGICRLFSERFLTFDHALLLQHRRVDK